MRLITNDVAYAPRLGLGYPCQILKLTFFMKLERSSAPPTWSEPSTEAAERTATVHRCVCCLTPGGAGGSCATSSGVNITEVFPYMIGRWILMP
jgi:hypothetical protein